jgi:hypothetical protein
MKTIHGEIPNEMFSNYLNRLTNGFYKILCLYEDRSKTLYKHIQSFIYELSGASNILYCFNNNPSYLVLLSTLESISDDVLSEEFNNQELVKSEIFKCISIINKLKQTTVESGDL